jgi:SSS family solute:Na+ symporter
MCRLSFPLVLAISLIGCFAGTLLTKPEPDEVLMDFLSPRPAVGLLGAGAAEGARRGPWLQALIKDFLRDMFNVVVGIAWQISLVALPLYIVIQEYQRAATTLAVILGTSAILKFTWYDHLAVRECETDKAAADDKADDK